MNKRMGILCFSLLLSSTVMIRAGNNPSSQSDPKFTALHKAASRGDFDTVVAYEGDDINALDSEGYSPLHYAVAKGHESIVDLLTQKGAKPIEGKNIVTIAVTNEQPRMALSLLLRGFQPDENTPRQAIRGNYYSVLSRCLPPTTFDINAQDPQTGETLLIESVRGSNVNKGMAHLLLQNGARGDIADKKGWLPIHLAVMGGMLNAVKLLLAQNKGYAVAPLVIDNKNGKSTLCMLSLYGSSPKPVDAIADELCKAGASAEQVNLGAVLATAKPENGDQVFSKLRALGASTEAANVEGRTPLMAALARKHEKIASTLIAEQDSPKKVDNEGSTLLHFAAAGGMHTFIKTIVEKYAISVNAADNDGDTPLHAASMHGNKEAAAVLRTLGAQEMKNKKGNTPADLALHADLLNLSSIVAKIYDDFDDADDDAGDDK